MPGTNITTASAWKYLRRALTLSVGTFLSAASSRSVATLEKWAPLGRSGRLGRLGKLGNLRPSTLSPGGVGGLLGSLSSAGAVLGSCGVVEPYGMTGDCAVAP